MRREIGGIALIVGAVIGAGIFGLPYAIQAIGFFPGVVMMALLAVLVGILTLAYADLVLQAPKHTQFASIIRSQLGKRIYYVAFAVHLVGLLGAMVAYTVEMGNLLSVLMSPWIAISPHVASVLIYGIGSILIAMGLRSVTGTEVALLTGIVFVILGFGIVAIPEASLTNLMGFEPAAWALPYGVILFALPGLSAIPDAARTVQRDPKRVKRIVVAGALLPSILYGIFAAAIISVTGGMTTESAIVGFGNAMGPGVLVIGAILGILTMGTSFLINGLVVTELFEFDAKLPHILSFFLALVPPLVIFLLIRPSFISVLSLIGAVLLAAYGVLILFSWRKYRRSYPKRPLLLSLHPVIFWLIFAILVFGALNQLFLSAT